MEGMKTVALGENGLSRVAISPFHPAKRWLSVGAAALTLMHALGAYCPVPLPWTTVRVGWSALAGLAVQPRAWVRSLMSGSPSRADNGLRWKRRSISFRIETVSYSVL